LSICAYKTHKTRLHGCIYEHPANNKNKNNKRRARRTRGSQALSDRNLPRFFRNDPFPPHSFHSLTYSSSDVVGNSTTLLFGTTKQFSLNSLYDPDVSGTGHQPYGFDQLCASTGPYTRYKVLGVSVKMRFMYPGNAGVYVAYSLLNPGSSATLTGLTATEAAEKHNTVLEFVPGTGTKEKILSFEMKTLAPIFNWTQSQFKNDIDTTTGSYAGSPGSQPKLNIVMSDMDGTPTNITVLTQITYHAMFYDRVQLAAS